jgi:hypothetical protein
MTADTALSPARSVLTRSPRSAALVRPATAAMWAEMVAGRAGASERGEDHADRPNHDRCAGNHHRCAPVHAAPAKRTWMPSPTAPTCGLRRRKRSETADQYQNGCKDLDHAGPPSIRVDSRWILAPSVDRRHRPRPRQAGFGLPSARSRLTIRRPAHQDRRDGFADQAPYDFRAGAGGWRAPTPDNFNARKQTLRMSAMSRKRTLASRCGLVVRLLEESAYDSKRT